MVVVRNDRAIFFVVMLQHFAARCSIVEITRRTLQVVGLLLISILIDAEGYIRTE